jgi:hypothetical protein
MIVGVMQRLQLPGRAGLKRPRQDTKPAEAGYAPVSPTPRGFPAGLVLLAGRMFGSLIRYWSFGSTLAAFRICLSTRSKGAAIVSGATGAPAAVPSQPSAQLGDMTSNRPTARSTRRCIPMCYAWRACAYCKGDTFLHAPRHSRFGSIRTSCTSRPFRNERFFVHGRSSFGIFERFGGRSTPRTPLL